MTYAYTVRGSEDGIIAIASSPFKAIAIAAAYVTQAGGTARDQARDSSDLRVTVADLRRRRTMHATIDNCPVGHVACSSMAQAEIEKFDINWSLGRDW